MIERNLRHVTLRRYGTAFFEAFGMLPLTYFGAVGDNFTDNYANIQVAINESIKRELKYIFVPEGSYYYTGVLLNVDDIIFIGNADFAKIYNEKNEEIKIYQIGTQIPYEKGVIQLDKNVTENGYIDIETKTKNPTDAILLIDGTAITINDTLTLFDGKLQRDKTIYLSDKADTTNNVYLDTVELIKNGVRLNYLINGTGGLINAEVEWRVR